MDEPASESQPSAVVDGSASEPALPVEEPSPPPAEEPAVAVPHDLDGLWLATLESVKAEHALLGAVFAEATPTEITEGELTLGFPPGAAFLKRKAEDSANRAILIDTLQRLTGRRYRVAFELRDDLPAAEAANGSGDTEEDIVARLIAELDAEELPEDWLAQQKGGD
jgi:DNA polymerase-3 subunit gamma/tau